MYSTFAQASANNPATLREAIVKMNLHFTFLKDKASDININPLKSCIMNDQHHSRMLLNPVIAGAIIINNKNELEPITMPTSMIKPFKEYDTAALWGSSLLNAAFVAIDSNELI